MKYKFNFCTVHRIMYTQRPQPKEIELYDRIMQEWLVSVYVKVIEVQAEAEAEDPPGRVEFYGYLLNLIEYSF